MASKANITGQTNPVAENYAAALFALAAQAGSIAPVNDELAQVAALVASNDKLAALFAHRTLDPARRNASLRNLFKGNVSDLTLRTLLLLSDKQRLDQLGTIAAAFDRRVKQAAGQVDVEVHSARPLDAAQLKSVGDRISKAIGATAVIDARVDASLIGGLRVRVGDKLLDASVAAQLRALARDLQSAGHEKLKARSGELVER